MAGTTGLEAYGTKPTEYKFFMFGGHVGSVGAVFGMGTVHQCTAWFDGSHTRLPAACVSCKKCGDTVSIGQVCPIGTPAQPSNWEAIKAVAIMFGEALAVHYRIDILASNQGPVLLEFTPWHANGRSHALIGCYGRHRRPAARSNW